MTKRQAMQGQGRGETEEERACHVSVAGENTGKNQTIFTWIYFNQARGETGNWTSLPVWDLQCLCLSWMKPILDQ